MKQAESDPAEQAAQWIVALSVDDEDEQKRAQVGYAQWKQADPRHAAAADRIQDLLDRLQDMKERGSARAARAALHADLAKEGKIRRPPKLKHIGSTLVLAVTLLVPAWLALPQQGGANWFADVRSRAGQWSTHVLSDGTRLSLRGVTAANIRYDAQRRAVELLGGEMLVDVAGDALRPFVVETAHGSIRALGTQFLVDRRKGDTIVTMLESKVVVTPMGEKEPGEVNRRQPISIGAGQRLRMDDHGATAISHVDVDTFLDAWQRRQWVVDSQSLPEVLDELARHRPGHILFDRARIAHFKVSGVLPLDDTDRALQLLVNSFPELRVRTFTPYLVRVDSANQP